MHGLAASFRLYPSVPVVGEYGAGLGVENRYTSSDRTISLR